MRFLVRNLNPLLPPGWQQDIAALSVRFGVDQKLVGGDPTSRTVDDRAGDSVYRVVTTSTIVKWLPWMGDLYWGPVLKFAQELDPEAHGIPDDECAININACGTGQGYEWHIDPNAPGALLFVTDANPGDGGELLMCFDDLRFELDIQPMAGMLLVFDARDAPHCVTEVTGLGRITMPMVYLGEGQTRDSDNSYLYGGD